MGSVYYQAIVGVEEARVGLLNIGSEPGKGTEFCKECYALLQEAPIRFVGNIEGHGIFKKQAEVVVCDGFTGNIFLKTVEGFAKSVFSWLKVELKQSPLRMAGAWLASGAFRSIKNRTSTDEYGGTPLLGVNGICIKAHGNSSPRALRNAIRAARTAVQLSINTRIVEAMKPLHEKNSSRNTLEA
jgi:glycerol-3-phosphate acyltransferase PlsX